MPTQWRVPDAVRRALGVHVDRVVGDLIDDPGRGCRACHQVRDSDGRSVDTLVLLRPTVPGRSGALIGYSHASCAPPNGVIDFVGVGDEIRRDGRAIAGDCRLNGVVTPLLVFEPGERPYVDTDGDLSDLFAITMLRHGFELLRGPVGAAAPGRAPEWSVAVNRGQVQLTGPNGVALHPTWSAGFNSEWEALAHHEGWVLVIAGTGIVPRDDGAGPARLTEATVDGRVVAAMVKIADESAPN